MRSFFVLALTTAIISSIFTGILSNDEYDPILFTHKGHNHNERGLEVLKIASSMCRAQFNPEHMGDWIKNIEACLAETQYENTEEVFDIKYEKYYSRDYNHDDKCFHNCVYEKMNFLEEVDEPLVDDGYYYIDEITIKGYKFVYEDTLPVFTVDYKNQGGYRDLEAHQVTAHCDNVARHALAEVYGHIQPNYDDLSKLQSKTAPPYNNTQCAYSNLFAYCVDSNYGNRDKYNYKLSYIYCIDRVFHKYMFQDLCNVHIKNDDFCEVKYEVD